MNTNSNIEELVSRYLEGEMSDIEKLNFENQLVNNTDLQEEFQLQKDILEGIQDYRKAELKARLDNIAVPSSGIYQYLGVKIAALVTLTTLIGFGAYFTFVADDQGPASEIAVVSDAQLESIQPEALPEIPEVKSEPEQPTTVISEQQPALKTQKNVKPEAARSEKEVARTTEPGSIPSPNIVKPDFVEGIAEEKIDHKGDSFDLKNNSFANVNRLAENNVEVETIFDKKKDFHYKFYNKKLFLYGDFERNPYEIIEYISDNTKLYFLYYEGKFYELEDSQMKVTPLAEIDDVQLVKELELIRK